ncbi:MAG: FtsQ-type POTRA domain-containing protein [Treponema sp.]|jgi:cell division protein FtsQ|nr:FtsQ-type POTRA domain-containing protein [Treponema sp.]
MLGDFIYSGEVEDASYKYDIPADTDKTQKIEKTVRRFLALAAVFISIGLVWIFCVSPAMVPVKIDIKTFQGFSKPDVLNLAGIKSGATYISIDAREAETLLSRHPMVESAKVIKRFPDRLSIFLEPRQAVAAVVARVNGRLQPVYIDRYGVAFSIGNGAGEAPPSWLPVVSGVLDERMPLGLGMRLNSVYLPLFSRIATISEGDSQIWQAVSEIGIAKKSNDLYDLVLYPVNSQIKLRLGSDISKENIYYALLMADVSKQLGGGRLPDEIDARSGLGVFRTKEAGFGE